MILGNYLYTLKKKPNNWLIAAIALSSYFFTIIGTYIISKRDNDMNEYFFESLKPNIIIMSLCVYLLFKNIRISIPQAFQKRIDIICEHSYGIFLAHILVLTILNKCGLDYPVFTAWLSIPLITILCFIISYALVYLLKQIPYLKSLIG
jgi:surface polysaccharide O-acyltransferase-like enzyme